MMSRALSTGRAGSVVASVAVVWRRVRPSAPTDCSGSMPASVLRARLGPCCDHPRRELRKRTMAARRVMPGLYRDSVTLMQCLAGGGVARRHEGGRDDGDASESRSRARRVYSPGGRQAGPNDYCLVESVDLGRSHAHERKI
jgi:hypothetical protein